MLDTPPQAPHVARGGSGSSARPGSGRGVRRFGAVLTVVVLAALAYGVFNVWAVWRASRTDVRRPSDAIVVLGAAQYDGRPSPALAARLDVALELYHEGLAPLVVTTGGNQAGDRFTEAQAGRDYLVERGVPPAAIVSIPVGTNTWQELEATAAALGPRDATRVILVSDSYHAYRVERVAGEVGLDGVVVSTPGAAPLDRLLRESAGAGVARLVGYGRLAR